MRISTDGRSWPRTFSVRILLALLAVAIAGTANALPSDPIDPGALQQIQALLQEKDSRTPIQQKIDSNLLYSLKMGRGQAIAAGIPFLDTGLPTDLASEIEIDITADISDSLLQGLQGLGANVLSSNPAYRSVRARAPLGQIEAIAALPGIIFVQPKQQAITMESLSARQAPLASVRLSLLPALRPGFAQRAALIRARLAAALAARDAKAAPLATNKLTTSEGDVTHRANLARSTFGVSGAGIKVGVLSDGVNSLATLQGSGDLPAGVTVVPGQAGSGDEGSAMLEIVYDLAPGAQLFFATAFTSITSFASNIHTLRNTYGCDIIIDDVFYFSETPFQKGQTGSVVSNTNGGIVTQAVNDVTAAGALYFTAAGNEGNKDDGTSGTWEGDFSDGGAIGPPVTGSGNYHSFAPSTNFDTISGSGFAVTLHWSDPLGGSANDYDLFILNSIGSSVLFASTNIQSGTQDPFEITGGAAAGNRVVIVKRTTAAARFLHLSTLRARLAVNTTGETHGHSAPPSANAFGVAATPAVFPGPYPSPFNSSDTVETFSSDGPRRYFFNADSSAITPGNFSSTGGVLVNKPDITAADGVSCSAPGFNPFYGTSAAAPHAGAIAALVKSSNPSLTAAQISNILTSTAIDIMAAGVDRDSGHGILDAYNAVQAAAVPTGRSFFTLTPCRLVDTRNPNGPLGGPSLVAGASRTFVFSGQCGIPLTAKAVSLNVVVVSPTAGPGHLTVYPASAPLPLSATINYNLGSIRANNSIMPLGASGDVSVFCGQGSGTADVVIDTNGYFQ